MQGFLDGFLNSKRARLVEEDIPHDILAVQ